MPQTQTQTKPETDWKIFAGPVLWLLLATLAGAGLAWAGLAYRQQAETVKTQRENALSQEKNEHEKNKRASETLDHYYVPFGRLQQRGFLGEYQTQRLLLGKLLETIKQAKIVQSFRYNISERRDYLLDNLELQKLKISEATLKLELELLHEGELLAFLDRLEQPDMPGLFNVQSCELKRAQNPGPDINLHADCTVSWYTVSVKQDTDTP